MIIDIIVVIVLLICLFTICKQEKLIKALRSTVEYAAEQDDKAQKTICEYQEENRHLYTQLKKYQDMVELSKIETKKVSKKSEEKTPAKRGRKPVRKEENK